MAPGRRSLGSFLATAARALSAPPAQRASPLTLVIGNESAGDYDAQLRMHAAVAGRVGSLTWWRVSAADVDSICTAVMCAYLRTHTAPYTLHIPLANVGRDDLRLRPELEAVLGPAGLRASDLLTLSELPELDPKQTRWLLVDHNALTGALGERYAGRVVGCIDHHDDEGSVPHDTGDEPRIIERAGSCMSLVLKYFRPTWDRLQDEDEDNDEDKDDDADADAHEPKSAADCNFELGRLALGPILVDTFALTGLQKTTAGDVSAVELAERALRTKYLHDISRLKEDLSGMSYRDVFRRDYKQWTEAGLRLGISVAPQGFDYLLANTGGERDLTDALRTWADERKLHVAAIMTTARPAGHFARELCVWAFDHDAARAVRRFADRNLQRLGLASWRDGALDHTSDDDAAGLRVCWTQSDLGSSRKQVGPLLREAIKERSDVG